MQYHMYNKIVCWKNWNILVLKTKYLGKKKATIILFFSNLIMGEMSNYNVTVISSLLHS